MNYQNIYNSIINKRKNETVKGYVEKHHILPKCLNGTNAAHNLIELTAREHYICHWLLCKIYKNTENYFKLLSAFMRMHCMNQNHRRYFNSKTYAYAKEQYSKLCSSKTKGKNNPNYGHTWIYNPELDVNKSVLTEELDEWLQEGWIKGRLINKVTVTDLQGNKTSCKREELLNKLENGYTINKNTAFMYLVTVYDSSSQEVKRILKKDLQTYIEKGFITYQDKVKQIELKNKGKQRSTRLRHDQLVLSVLDKIEDIVSSCYTLKEVQQKSGLSKSVIRDAYRLKTGKGDLRNGLKRRSKQTKLYENKCFICGRIFQSRSKKVLYCSYECRKNNHSTS